MLRKTWVLLVALGAAPGCALFAPEDTGDDTCSREPPLDWRNFGEGFMTKHCTGCHSSLLPESAREGAPLGIDFDTYQDVLDRSDRIVARSVGDDATMPPGGGPTADERANLAEWLACEVADDQAALGGGGAE